MRKVMNALVAHNPGDYRYEQLPKPILSGKEILIKVLGCGICAGDLKIYHGLPAVWGSDKTARMIDAPIIPGHEFCGEIVDTGYGESDYSVGDFVVAEQIVPCNKCVYCKSGEYWMCPEISVFGLKKNVQGGFAEYVKLPEGCRVHKLPRNMSIKQGALIEPYACGMHAVERAHIKHMDVVVIAGMGVIGLAITNIVKLALPKTIICIDCKEKRLSLGEKFGADVILNFKEHSIPDEVMRLTNGIGCDVYIEASGSPTSVTQGLKCLRNHGRYVQFGMLSDQVVTNWNIIGDGKELEVFGSHLSALCYAATIKGISSGLLKTDELVSHEFKLSKWRDAFETAEKDPEAMKVVLIPDEAINV